VKDPFAAAGPEERSTIDLVVKKRTHTVLSNTRKTSDQLADGVI
jgi:hypothetical protein